MLNSVEFQANKYIFKFLKNSKIVTPRIVKQNCVSNKSHYYFITRERVVKNTSDMKVKNCTQHFLKR